MRYKIVDKKTRAPRYYADDPSQGPLETDDITRARDLVNEGHDYNHDDDIVDTLA